MRCIISFVLRVLEYCSAVWCSADDTNLKLLDRVVSYAIFLTMYLRVTLQIGDLCQYYVCCARSGVTRCTLLMMLFLSCMCQSLLLAVHWPHIGTHTNFLAAEPHSTTGLLFFYQYICGMFLVTLYSMVSRAGFKSRANAFYWALSLLFSYYSPFLFYSIGWHYGAGVFGLTGCLLITLSQPDLKVLAEIDDYGSVICNAAACPP